MNGVPPMNAESRARMRDGAMLAYSLHRCAASPKRAVLIHSLAMDRDFWHPVVQPLADSASVLVYDCRGHGASDKPPGPYSVEQFADDLADLMDHAGWDSAVIAGASMGGCIALAFAAAYSPRVAALGLFDTTAWYGADAPSQWAERAQRAIESGLGAMVEFQTKRWFTDTFRAEHPDVIAASVATFRANDPRAYAETCRMLGACDVRDALPRFTMPTAIVVGEEDYATPIAMAQSLHAAIEGSTLAVIPHARHLTPLECPERIAAELRRLLDLKATA